MVQFKYRSLKMGNNGESSKHILFCYKYAIYDKIWIYFRRIGDYMTNNRWIKYSILIGLSFLWTGTAYISQVYKLLEHYSPDIIDVVSQVWYYLMQIIGLSIFSLIIKRSKERALSFHTISLIILAEAIIITSTLLVNSPQLILILGLLMNIFHGMIAGYYLLQLSLFVPKEHRGKAFGFAYAFGSLGSWVLSIPFNGQFLKMKLIVFVYLLLMAMTVLLIRNLRNNTYEQTSYDRKIKGFDNKFVIIVFFTIVLLTFTKGVGFYFPMADISGIVDLEFSRGFYALGLIIAGLINDKNRKFGSVLAVISLIFPFVAIALKNDSSVVVSMWIMGYIFLGFISVYRIIVFSDIEERHSNLLPLATFGLLSGRIGDLLGTIIGVIFNNNTIGLLAITGISTAIMIPAFLTIYQKLYLPVLNQEESKESKYNNFSIEYNLSSREREVLNLLLLGYSNLDIANELFISERTVKFHVTNILKKTNCRNRNEVTTLFEYYTYF